MTEVDKPPLGLIPRWVAEATRHTEVHAALSRYLAANYPLPQEWVDEYNERTKGD